MKQKHAKQAQAIEALIAVSQEVGEIQKRQGIVAVLLEAECGANDDVRAHLLDAFIDVFCDMDKSA